MVSENMMEQYSDTAGSADASQLQGMEFHP